ncbi:hypothetical protein [Brevirhabdus sp.]|uniref:hypothetical protein n=1 Tax=Brevirhabdus sp. TaxID=2004514 RepID=UPI0040588E23
MNSQPQQTVRSRRVFYIPGYDPIHPRRYRELYRKQSRAQAAVSGYRIALTPKTGPGPYGWDVEATIEDGRVDARIEVLVWSDIVRNSMSTGIAATYLQMLQTAWIYITSGALFRLMRLRKGPVIAALYPVFFLLAQLLVALLLAWAAGAALAAVLPRALAIPAWLAGLAVLPPVLMWFRKHDNKVFAYYLMHDYAYSARTRGANPPELEERMRDFTRIIAQALAEGPDEVLVVGHSSGAHLAVSILSDLIRAGGVAADGPRLSFLSLGQVVPMVSFLPEAKRLRADLHFLSQRSELAWVDVTAPGDGCAFALCDPVAVSGVSPETGKRWPLVISAAFTQTLSPARWKELRWRFFRLHFQYLCAFDRPGDYDYFRITAGPMTLAERFSGRAASKSRIETAVSPHRSMAA